jgi:hypothetical protein
VIAVFKNEDPSGKCHWLHYTLIGAGERVLILDMEPALWSGWNLRSHTVQTLKEEWCGMNADQVVRWKEHNHPDQTRCDQQEADNVIALARSRGLL